MDKFSISIIGAGRLGSTLALALSQRGCKITGIADSDPVSLNSVADAVKPQIVTSDPVAAAQGAEIILLTAPDGQLKAISDRMAAGQTLGKGQILCHCSGSLPSSVLVSNKMLGASVYSMHPLASFSKSLSPWDQYKGIYFGVEGDAAASGTIERLIKLLNCFTVRLAPGKKELYHLAGVMASNYLVALLLSAREIMEKAAGPDAPAGEMIHSLAMTVMGNAANGKWEEAISGPIERGDVQTVAGHIQALKKDYPQGEELYRALGKAILKAVQKRHSQMKGLDEIKRLFE